MRLRIDVFSDVVCPWCWVGKRRLSRALEQRPEVEADIVWRPFLLHPWLPPEGVDRETLYLRKLGTPRAADALVERIREAGRTVGLDFDFERMERVPDTTDAHCVIGWAREAGVQDQLVERLFRAYFVQGEDVSRHGVLAAHAEVAGMDRDEVLERLDRGDDRGPVSEAAEGIRDRGVTGVPFILIGGKVPIMGAQEPDTIVRAIDRARSELADAAPSAAGAR